MGTIVMFPGAGAQPLTGLPLEALLSSIPSLPRPVLARLTARMIDRMDEMDGDPDLEEDNEDRCSAGDDGCAPVPHRGELHWGSREDELGH